MDRIRKLKKYFRCIQALKSAKLGIHIICTKLRLAAQLREDENHGICRTIHLLP